MSTSSAGYVNYSPPLLCVNNPIKGARKTLKAALLRWFVRPEHLCARFLQAPSKETKASLVSGVLSAMAPFRWERCSLSRPSGLNEEGKAKGGKQ